MDEKYKSIPQSHIDELTAIYTDYLYMSREHEAVLQTMSVDSLANSYLQDLHPNVAKFVWQGDMLTPEELLVNKMITVGPSAKKIQQGIYEYAHPDGQITRLDFTNHRVLYTNRPSIQESKEKYPNGLEIDVYNGQIVAVKLPNGVIINMRFHTINWDTKTAWYANNEGVNILQTDKSKIFMGTDLRVTKYVERVSNLPFAKGDNILIDRRHNLVLDSMCKIREFKFRNAENTILRTQFTHMRDGNILITFPDGTTVTQSGITLTYDNRADFAMAYNLPQNTITPTHTTPGHVR